MIYTIGYTGVRLAQIEAVLDAHQALLVDIRYRPQSHNPVYNQKALQAALGARYVPVGELGNRNYKDKGGPIDIVDLPAGIRAVHALLQRAPAVVLLCVCTGRDFARCHRVPVGEALTEALGIPVEHIELAASKSRQNHQLTLGL